MWSRCGAFLPHLSLRPNSRGPELAPAMTSPAWRQSRTVPTTRAIAGGSRGPPPGLALRTHAQPVDRPASSIRRHGGCRGFTGPYPSTPLDELYEVVLTTLTDGSKRVPGTGGDGRMP